MKEQVCIRCNYQGYPKFKTPGGFGMELVLWLLFLIPGLIYSIWRHANRGPVCAYCGAKEFVPADSPKGQELATSMGGQAQRKMQDQLRGKKAKKKGSGLTGTGIVLAVVGVFFLLGESPVWGLFLLGFALVAIVFGIESSKVAKARYEA